MILAERPKYLNSVSTHDNFMTNYYLAEIRNEMNAIFQEPQQYMSLQESLMGVNDALQGKVVPRLSWLTKPDLSFWRARTTSHLEELFVHCTVILGTN